MTVSEKNAPAAGSVSLIGVTKTYRDAVAVDGIDLKIEPGEFISLLGPSGCGKTTTLRMIAGFEQPTAGEILIGDRSVVGLPPYRRDVNTVFQAYALFPHMTVAENVAYGLQQRKRSKAEIRTRVAESLQLARMTAYADRKPAQLSGGQQQRVALARALVNRPSVLLLDEPLGALDRQLREEMQVELKLLQSQLGITFVFVTHDQAEALSMSDRIAIMRAGRIEQLADAETVYQRPANAYVASFVGQQNFFTGHVRDAALVTGWGVLQGDVPPQAVEGAAWLGAVRPESIALTAGAAAPGTNTVSGTVLSVSPLGETVQYVVRAGEQDLLVRSPTPTAPRVLAGDPVTCSWPARSVAFFAPENSA